MYTKETWRYFLIIIIYHQKSSRKQRTYVEINETSDNSL